MAKPMNRAEFERIGSGIWGGHGWKSAAASAFEVDRKTIGRWIAADSVPDWAATKLRALSSIAPPPNTTADEDRDDECAEAIEGELSRVVELAGDAGWHRAEIQTAILSLTISNIRHTAGASAAVEILRQAINLISADLR